MSCTSLVLIIHVLRGSGIPYFGMCPEGRGSALVKQPKSKWDRAPGRIMKHNAYKKTLYISVKTWKYSSWIALKLCSLMHLNFFFNQCDSSVFKTVFKTLDVSSKRKKGERVRVKGDRERTAPSEIAFIMWPWGEFCHKYSVAKVHQQEIHVQ